MRASLIERHSPPEILVHGLVKPEDVEKLFQMWVLTDWSVLSPANVYVLKFL